MPELERDRYLRELLDRYKAAKDLSVQWEGLQSPSRGGRAMGSGDRGLLNKPAPSALVVPGFDLDDRVASNVGRVLDTDLEQRSAPEIPKALATLFGQGWEDLDPRARSSLIQGERLRQELDEYASEDPHDFGIAVFAYSRALEIELNRRIFEPYKREGEIVEEMDAQSPKLERAIEVIKAYKAGARPIGMGEMAHSLSLVGCGQENGFSRFLRRWLLDYPSFCAGDFAKKLQRYAQGYRNRAAHSDPVSLKSALKARKLLLEEPTRLLHRIIEAAPA